VLGQESELHSHVYLRQQLFGPEGMAFHDSPTAQRGRMIGGQRRPAHRDSWLSGKQTYAGQHTESSVIVAKFCK